MSELMITYPSGRKIEITPTDEKPFGDMTHQEILDIISLCKQGKGTILLSCKAEVTDKTGWSDDIVFEPMCAVADNAIIWTKMFSESIDVYELVFRPDEILTSKFVIIFDDTDMSYSYDENLVLSNVRYNIITW